ncbi:hypothetical protein EC973_001329 [Apophysomyces ossiformis]|uniref:Pyrrolo-quinoline quinone repeat domain-containing protein n=1 Tax=Apophysomyces ossiformis TaxID=679940 RepID=A0A8H7BXZ7_9FUNG|nr:hypothetical protein EC973_001329 [Apophysomyces ossiformis]
MLDTLGSPSNTFPLMNPFKKSEKEALSDGESDTESINMANAEFTRNEILLCATHGKIYAIRKNDGARLWRQKFPTGAMGGIVSIFVTDTDKVLVGANGKTACLNLTTGETLWVNKMPGMGYEEVSLICPPSRVLAPQLRTPTVHDEELPSYEEDQQEKPVVLGSSRGKVIAIDADTGEEVWKYNCPGGGYNLPTMLVEPPSAENGLPYQVVYVGCGRWIYCLRSLTGELIWSRRISNAKFGLGYMTMATPWSSRLAAEAHTAFAQQPIAQQRNEAREREKRS